MTDDILDTISQRFDGYHREVKQRLDKTGGDVTALAERLHALEASSDLLETRISRAGTFGGSHTGGPTLEQRAHVDAFTAWIRNPMDRRATARLIEAETAATGPDEVRLTSGLTGADGGHLIPAPVLANIARRVVNVSPIRQIARVVSVSSTATKFPIDRGGTGSGWVGENGTRTATAEPVLDLRAPTYGTVYGLISATEEILMDAGFDIGEWLADSVATAIAAAEGAAFTTGNGTNRPTGFLNGTPVTTADATRASGVLQYIPGGAASAISSVDGLINLFYSVKAAHRANASWLMNSATAAAVALLKDTTGRALWSPALSESVPPTLLGRPVVVGEDMPAVAANNFPVAFGDFREGYLVVDQGGLRLTLDDNVTSPGIVRWYVRRRVGGCVLNSEAIKVLRVSTT